MNDAVATSVWRARLVRWQLLIRYYQAGLIALGLSAYPAQALSHVLGMAFNYVTYSRHVFRDAGSAKLRFAASYAVNYVMSVATLAGLKQAMANDYLAGLLAAVIVSVINYVALKYLVFRKAPA